MHKINAGMVVSILFCFPYGVAKEDLLLDSQRGMSGVSVLGAFKLDRLQPVKMILSQSIPNFLIFILEVQFLITPDREAGYEKWDSLNSE